MMRKLVAALVLVPLAVLLVALSVVNRKPVIQDLAAFWPATAELALAAIALSAALGIPLGVLSAVRAGRWVRLPSATHSGHWWPTEASFMQSGQIGRSQRVQRT